MKAVFSVYMCGCTLLSRTTEALHPAWCSTHGHKDGAAGKATEEVTIDPGDERIAYGWRATSSTRWPEFARRVRDAQVQSWPAQDALPTEGSDK